MQGVKPWATMFEASDQRASPDPIGKHTLLFCYPALSLGDALRSEDGGLFFLHFLSEKKHGILRYDIAQDRGRDTYPQISTIFYGNIIIQYHTIIFSADFFAPCPMAVVKRESLPGMFATWSLYKDASC